MFSPLAAGQRVAAPCIMPRFLRRAVTLGVLVAALCIPAPALAVTLDEIVGLAHAGVTDAVILALIDRDKTIFTLEPQQIVRLQSEGLSEPVILAMLKSGRGEGDDAARADAADTAAFIRSGLAPGPDLVIVGHGPERPNTSHAEGFYSAPGNGSYFIPPYVSGAGGYRRGRGTPAAPFVPSLSPFNQPYRSPFREPVIPPVGFSQTAAPAMCFAQTSTRSSTTGYVTECPAVMQPIRRR
jgi:hypothetical protein